MPGRATHVPSKKRKLDVVAWGPWGQGAVLMVDHS